MWGKSILQFAVNKGYFIQQGHIKLIKSDSKDVYNVKKISISNK